MECNTEGGEHNEHSIYRCFDKLWYPLIKNVFNLLCCSPGSGTTSRSSYPFADQTGTSSCNRSLPSRSLKRSQAYGTTVHCYEDWVADFLLFKCNNFNECQYIWFVWIILYCDYRWRVNWKKREKMVILANLSRILVWIQFLIQFANNSSLNNNTSCQCH